jgi:hypothetical protein
MINARWTKRMQLTKTTKRAIWSGVVGLVVLTAFAPGSARAQDDDEENSIWNLDKRIINGFAKGLGLQRGDAPGIDYRERSPLVVPPSRDLPAPETTGTSRSAAWPVDADTKRREDVAARKKLDRRGYDEVREGRSLMPSEIDGPGTRSRGPDKPGKPSDADVDGTNYKPSDLGYFGGIFSGSAFGFGGQKEEYGTFTKEPPRQALTVPPVGYQTPSAAQPYGVSKDKARQSVTPLDPAVGVGSNPGR